MFSQLEEFLSHLLGKGASLFDIHKFSSIEELIKVLTI